MAIAEAGTLTRAAELLFKTQGAVSNDVKALEQSLGVELIDRSGQRVKLTTAGVALLPVARSLLEGVESMRATARRLRSGDAAIVRIAAVPSVANQLPAYVRDFNLSGRPAHFRIQSGLLPSIVGQLLHGQLDFVIGPPDLELNLALTSLGSEALYFLMRADDQLATRSGLSANDVVNRKFVGFIREMKAAAMAERFFTRVGVYPEQIVEVDDFHILWSLICLGIGIALVPASAVVQEPPVQVGPSCRLVAVPPDPPMYRDLAIMRLGGSMPPQAQAFHDFLAESWVPPSLAVPLSQDGAPQNSYGLEPAAPVEPGSS